MENVLIVMKFSKSGIKLVTIQPQLLRMTMTFLAINLTLQIGPIEFVSENTRFGKLVSSMSESFEGLKKNYIGVNLVFYRAY